MPQRSHLPDVNTLIAALPQPAMLLDAAGRILLANAALRRTLGGAVLVRAGDEAARLFSGAAEAIAAALRGEAPAAVAGEGCVIRALPLDTGALLLMEPAAPGGAARLEILGRLAGGIAHDFNNLLGVVLGASAVLRRIAPQPEAATELAAIDQAAQRGTALIRQLLAFARQQVMAPRIIDVNESIRQLVILLPRLLGADILLALELEEPSRRIRVDPSQWDQVLLNLVVNARDAMKGQGHLRIETGRRLVLAGEALKPGPSSVTSTVA